MLPDELIKDRRSTSDVLLWVSVSLDVVWMAFSVVVESHIWNGFPKGLSVAVSHLPLVLGEAFVPPSFSALFVVQPK